MHRRPALVVGLTLLALAASAPAAADGHIPAVQAELAAFEQRLSAIVDDANATPAEKQARVAKELDRRLDYGYLAAAALGKRIESFSREQFARFAHAYAHFLQDFFVGMIATSEGGDFEVLKTAEDAEKRVIVTVKAAPRKGYIPGALRVPRSPSRGDTISYAFRKSSDGWRIAGVAFGGVDVSTTFGGQFQAYLDKNDPDALIAELRRRNAEYQGTNPFAP